jgi:adenine/guanine phosphoribosyltransferase-like PRPP-binding protein
VTLREKYKLKTTANTILRKYLLEETSNFGYYIKRKFLLILTHVTEYSQDSDFIRLRRVDDVVKMGETINTYRNLVEKPLGKGPTWMSDKKIQITWN